MHVVSHVPNFLWDKQARAAHTSLILYGKNLKEITLISKNICYRSILANVLMDMKNYMGRSSFKHTPSYMKYDNARDA